MALFSGFYGILREILQKLYFFKCNVSKIKTIPACSGIFSQAFKH